MSDKCTACDGIGYSRVKSPPFASCDHFRLGCWVCNGSGVRPKSIKQIMQEVNDHPINDPGLIKRLQDKLYPEG